MTCGSLRKQWPVEFLIQCTVVSAHHICQLFKVYPRSKVFPLSSSIIQNMFSRLVWAPAMSTHVMACPGHSLYSPRWHGLIDASPLLFPGKKDVCKMYWKLVSFTPGKIFSELWQDDNILLKQVNKLRGDLEYTNKDSRPCQLACYGLHGEQPKSQHCLSLIF